MRKFSKKQVLELSKKYSYRATGELALTEKEIKDWLKKHKHLDKKRFVRLCLWKSSRQKRNYNKNKDSLIREITGFSFSTRNEEVRIKSLLVLTGVSYPVASTILHFAFPKRYPIMDFRVIWSLDWNQPKRYTFDFWQKYCNEIRKLSKKFNLPIRTIDKALWTYSKENQRT